MASNITGVFKEETSKSKPIPKIITPNFVGRTIIAAFNITTLNQVEQEEFINKIRNAGYGASILCSESPRKSVTVLHVQKNSSATPNFESLEFRSLIGEWHRLKM